MAQCPAHVGEVSELRVPCLLAAGGGLKRQVARGRRVVYSLIVCVQRVVCVLVVVASVALPTALPICVLVCICHAWLGADRLPRV